MPKAQQCAVAPPPPPIVAITPLAETHEVLFLQLLDRRRVLVPRLTRPPQPAMHASGSGDPLRLWQPPHARSRDVRSPACWRSCCPGVACLSVPAAVGNSPARCPAALA